MPRRLALSTFFGLSLLAASAIPAAAQTSAATQDRDVPFTAEQMELAAYDGGDLPRGVSGESEVILFPDALVLIRCRLRRRVLPRTPLTRAAPVFPDIRGTVIIVRGRINRVRRISVVELNHQRGLVPRGGGVQLLDVRGLEVKPLQRLFLGHGIVAKPEKPSSSSPPPALSSSLSRSPPEIFGFGIHGFLAHSLLLSGIFTRLRPRNSLTPSYR